MNSKGGPRSAPERREPFPCSERGKRGSRRAHMARPSVTVVSLRFGALAENLQPPPEVGRPRSVPLAGLPLAGHGTDDHQPSLAMTRPSWPNRGRPSRQYASPCPSPLPLAVRSEWWIVSWLACATQGALAYGGVAEPKKLVNELAAKYCHSACNFDPLSRGIGVQN